MSSLSTELTAPLRQLIDAGYDAAFTASSCAIRHGLTVRVEAGDRRISWTGEQGNSADPLTPAGCFYEQDSTGRFLIYLGTAALPNAIVGLLRASRRRQRRQSIDTAGSAVSRG